MGIVEKEKHDVKGRNPQNEEWHPLVGHPNLHIRELGLARSTLVIE